MLMSYDELNQAFTLLFYWNERMLGQPDFEIKFI